MSKNDERNKQYNERDGEDTFRRQHDAEMNHNIGYLIGKFESLDRYIRDHMNQEEARFALLERSVKRITYTTIVLTAMMALSVAGIPIDALLVKLLGALL